MTTKNSLRLIRTQLPSLGVDPECFGQLGYAQTQAIGEAVAFLGCDGLIAPSARWDCDNLILFNDNHGIENELDVLSNEAVDWIAWGLEKGIISLPDKIR